MTGSGKPRVGEAAVKAQYEAFPYPDVAVSDAGGMALAAMPSDLLAINQYIYAGARKFSEPFQVLVAGGGTGIATVRLAQQLKQAGCPSRVVYLDLSEASRDVAKRRARSFDLDNIDFHTGSLLDLPQLDLGPFDYIDCGGVLHHLEVPGDGLQSLADCLKPDGGMGLMLYAPYGRAGIYPVQEAMRRLGDGDQRSRIPLLKQLLDHLPTTHALWHHERFKSGYGEDDAELVDLFLHPVDRPFSVPELKKLCDGAGLRIVRFVPTGKYEPVTYTDAPDIRERMLEAGWPERAALAELLAGNIHMHFFFAVGAGNTRETHLDFGGPEFADCVPVLRDTSGDALADKLAESETFGYAFDGTRITVTVTPLMRAIVAGIDGERTVEDIYLELAGRHEGLDWLGFQKEFASVYLILHEILYGLFLTR